MTTLPLACFIWLELRLPTWSSVPWVLFKVTFPAKLIVLAPPLERVAILAPSVVVIVTLAPWAMVTTSLAEWPESKMLELPSHILASLARLPVLVNLTVAPESIVTFSDVLLNDSNNGCLALSRRILAPDSVVKSTLAPLPIVTVFVGLLTVPLR